MKEIMPGDIACLLFGVIGFKSSNTAYKASFGFRKSTELLSPDFLKCPFGEHVINGKQSKV